VVVVVREVTPALEVEVEVALEARKQVPAAVVVVVVLVAPQTLLELVVVLVFSVKELMEAPEQIATATVVVVVVDLEVETPLVSALTLVMSTALALGPFLEHLVVEQAPETTQLLMRLITEAAEQYGLFGVQTEHSPLRELVTYNMLNQEMVLNG
jgi:hypothetical protein